jgi:hypothetical protein
MHRLHICNHMHVTIKQKLLHHLEMPVLCSVDHHHIRYLWQLHYKAAISNFCSAEHQCKASEAAAALSTTTYASMAAISNHRPLPPEPHQSCCCKQSAHTYTHPVLLRLMLAALSTTAYASKAAISNHRLLPPQTLSELLLLLLQAKHKHIYTSSAAAPHACSAEHHRIR